MRIAGMTKAAMDLIANFPGPVTLTPSRVKWSLMLLASGLMVTGSVWVTWLSLSSSNPDASIALTFGIVGTVFFGVGGIVGILALQPGACSLNLNEAGFEVTNLYWTRAFFWEQVSDFATFSGRATQWVVFRSVKPYLGFWEKIGADFAGGRNGGLPDTYGFSAAELAHILSTWQRLAANAAGSGASGQTI
jgi:hypothetical protein